jgi:hypothetical protein
VEIEMPVLVYRHTEKSHRSEFGTEIDSNATVSTMDDVVRIGFSTMQSEYSVLLQPDSFR